MEFDYSNLISNIINSEKRLEEAKLGFFYRYKKMSRNQTDFTKSLIKNILENQASLYEFSPTLDKLFLICSSLYSVLNFQKYQNLILNQSCVNKTNKFILLVKTEDIILDAMKNFQEIFNLSKNSKNKIFTNQIVPFLDRKLSCINEKASDSLSSIDFDMFCNSITSSWVGTKNQCPSFKVNFYIINS